MATAAPTPATVAPSPWDRLRRSTLFYPLVGLFVISVLMAFAGDAFVSVSNFTNILRQVSVVAIIAVGMTFVILSGGIDLSVGAVMALTGTVAAGLMAGGMDPGFPVHNFLLGAGRYGLTQLASLDRLPARGAVIVVAPLKLVDGTGSPSRVFAFVER